MFSATGRAAQQHRAFGLDSPGNEPDRIPAGTVHPVQVIDEEDDRGLRAHISDQLEGRERHEEPVGCVLLVAEAKRAEQRRAVPGREPARPVQDRTQQPVQRSEPQMRLLLGAADGQHDEPATSGLIGSRPEQGGLAHPRIADHGERVPAPGYAIERRADVAQLRFSPEKLP